MDREQSARPPLASYTSPQPLLTLPSRPRLPACPRASSSALNELRPPLLARARFRKAGYAAIDRVCDYFEYLEKQDVVPSVKSGDIMAQIAGQLGSALSALWAGAFPSQGWGRTAGLKRRLVRRRC